MTDSTIAPDNTPPCRFGYVEYDGDQYCFAHGGFRCRVVGGLCSKHPKALDGAK